jgi:hypothetical protein
MAFTAWLQYSHLRVELSVIIKAATVFSGTLLLSWSTVVMLGRLALAAHARGHTSRRTWQPAGCYRSANPTTASSRRTSSLPIWMSVDATPEGLL